MEESEEQSDDSPKRGNHETETFRLHMVTWNVATADPPDDVSSLLHFSSPKSPDLYVIGLQEVYSGPLRFVADSVFDDPWSHLLMSTLAPRKYVKISSIRMQGLLLLFFSKLEHVPFIRDIRTTYTRTGLFGYWGNKGAVTVRLSFYGHMLCFLNCHLSAHMKYATARVNEFEYIMDTQTFECEQAPSVLDHRLVFWFGDLNFRIQDHGMHFVRSCINSHKYNLLWSNDQSKVSVQFNRRTGQGGSADPVSGQFEEKKSQKCPSLGSCSITAASRGRQLMMMKKKVESLQEFEEGPLDFQPTYKFDLHSDTYDSSGKKRKPAWTDRILWRQRPKPALPPVDEDSNNRVKMTSAPGKQMEEFTEFPLKIKQELYTSQMEYGISDHKPVIALFCLELRKMQDSPLVCLRAVGDWSADIDSIVLYSPQQPFPSSSWDWIGLYKVGFTSVSDYITYTWVKDNEAVFSDEHMQVFISKEEIPVRGGDCVLCYYSSTLQCIIGISEPFKVHESKVALEEGLMPEKLNGLDQIVADEFWK